MANRQNLRIGFECIYLCWPAGEKLGSVRKFGTLSAFSMVNPTIQKFLNENSKTALRIGIQCATLLLNPVFWTLKNADFADSERKNLRLSAFICVPQRQKRRVAH